MHNDLECPKCGSNYISQQEAVMLNFNDSTYGRRCVNCYHYWSAPNPNYKPQMIYNPETPHIHKQRYCLNPDCDAVFIDISFSHLAYNTRRACTKCGLLWETCKACGKMDCQFTRKLSKCEPF